jgi:hypothetical protein
MVNSIDKKNDENVAEPRQNIANSAVNEQYSAEARNAANRAAEERRARIKKMRGWLSPRDTVADDFGPEDAALYYGEGHSGWNR